MTTIPKPPKEKLIYFPKEGGHWYAEDGTPMYTVMGKTTGRPRATTLRDAKKLNLFPSVTGIMKVIAAPGLEQWKREQLLLSAVTLPWRENENVDDFVKRVLADADAQAASARTDGTECHLTIEQMLLGEKYEQKWSVHAQAFITECEKWMGTLKGVEPEKCFVHPIGYGGKSDVPNPAVNMLADIKTKAFDENSLPGLYDEHPMQLAAYREGLGMPGARCAIFFVSVTVPGLVHVVEVDEAELQRGWDMFCLAVQLWQLKNRYVPNSNKD